MLLSKIKSIKPRLSFSVDFFRFCYFLSKSVSKPLPTKSTGKDYIVVLSPWSLTSTPWFSITVGLLLFKRNHNVQYLVDDLKFENGFDYKLQVLLVKSSLFLLKKTKIKVDYLSKFKSVININSEELSEINKLAFANTIHKNRGEDNTPLFNENLVKNKRKLESNFSYIKEFVTNHLDKNFIVPGGIYGDSGIFEFQLKTNKMSYFTFDSGFGVLMSTYKGIAAQLADIPASAELLFNCNEQEIEYAINSSKNELYKRKNGTNKLNSQYQSFNESQNFEEVGILMPLNSPWDSAALNIATVFKSYNEWLIETIRIVLENSNFKITVRQHPDERYWWGKTSTDFKKMIDKEFNNNERIQFVSCYDKVNSYALLEKADAVICYSSTFGIESVISNKSVCVCSNVYYSKLDFSYIAKVKEDIVFFLNNINSKGILSDPYRASVAYYLGQQCNWLFTCFTPMNGDFDKWVKISVEDLLIDPTVQLYLESLENFLPLSYVTHKKNYQKNKTLLS